MPYRTVVLLGIGLPVFCLATTPAPYAAVCAALDRAVTTTSAQPAKAGILRTIEGIALGRTDRIDSEAEAEAGFQDGALHQRYFADPAVRACAFRAIGRSELAEVVDFLAGVRLEDVGVDRTQTIWPAAQVALREAQLRRIAEPDERTAFLENVVTERHDAIAHAALAWWAIDELCDRGSLRSLPLIRQWIRKSYVGQRAEDLVAYCEARIQVVTSNPDRVKALGSVLNVAAAGENLDVLSWALNQLSSMKSASADAELDRFAREVEEMPSGSSERGLLGAYLQPILARRKEGGR